MFTNQARLVVTSIFLALMAFFFYERRFELAAAVLLLIALLIWGYFKEGPIILAAKFYHDNNFTKAEALLRQIHNPNWLSKKRRGFYEFMLGGICLKRNEYKQAECHYEIAARYPLRSTNDHVAALVHVANISLRFNEFDKAETYLTQATRDYDKINARMKEVIAKIEKELKARKAGTA